MAPPSPCPQNLALIAQRSLYQHLLSNHHVINTALADITPSLVTLCAPVPTFRVLAAFDDVATHIILDSLFLGFRTRKMNLAPSSSFVDPAPPPAPLILPPESMFHIPINMVNAPVDFYINVNSVADILCRYVSDQSSLVEVTHLVISSIPWLQQWVEQELPLPYIRHFCRHLQRYIAMHSPMAGYDICETTRFDCAPNASSLKTRGISQATLVATRAWTPGEELLLCGGRLVPLSNDEENALQEQGRDFSVLLLQRSGDQNLFLGPGRFVNHDCQPNLAFVVRNTGEVHFRVIKSIAVGQELSVSYGNDYFGPNNTECMCETCELTHRGWFALHGRGINAVQPDDEPWAQEPSPNEQNNMHESRNAPPELASNGPPTTTAPAAPYLDWFDGPIAEGSDDVDRSVMRAAISALSDFQRRHYLAITGLNAQILGDSLTVPCVLCQCRTYVYRVAPQGHVHCHKCLRNVMLFSVPWPNRVPPIIPVGHQQLAGEKLADTLNRSNPPVLADGSRQFSHGSLLAEVEQRLLKLNFSPPGLSPSVLAEQACSPDFSDPVLPSHPPSPGIQCVMPPLLWGSNTPRFRTIASTASLSPSKPELLIEHEHVPVATPHQIAQWRLVQKKLDRLREIPAKLRHVKWLFNDEGPLLVKNYNQRNLVLCADKGTWYPAVTVPVSDWEDQKLDVSSPDSFHVLFLNVSTRSYGCVHRLDMVLVTDILRGGKSLLVADNEDSSPNPQVEGVKVPMVMRAGRDVEIVLKSVQSTAVERALAPPPRAVWQKWHAEYKITTAQSDSSPFQYHPFANIDVRPLASIPKPALVTRISKSKSNSATPSDPVTAPSDDPKITPSPPVHCGDALGRPVDTYFSPRLEMLPITPTTVSVYDASNGKLSLEKGRLVEDLVDNTLTPATQLKETAAPPRQLDGTAHSNNIYLPNAAIDSPNSITDPGVSPIPQAPPKSHSITKGVDVPGSAADFSNNDQQLSEFLVSGVPVDNPTIATNRACSTLDKILCDDDLSSVSGVPQDYQTSPKPTNKEISTPDMMRGNEELISVSGVPEANHTSPKPTDSQCPTSVIVQGDKELTPVSKVPPPSPKPTSHGFSDRVQGMADSTSENRQGYDSIQVQESVPPVVAEVFGKPNGEASIKSQQTSGRQYSDHDIQAWGQLRCVQDFSSEDEEYVAYSLYMAWLEKNERRPSSGEKRARCSAAPSGTTAYPRQSPAYSISAILNPPTPGRKPRNSDGRPSKKRKHLR